MKLAVFSAGTVLLHLAVALTLGQADPGTHQLGDSPRARRGWSMMRLGRGLQMLRLGKRMAAPPPSLPSQATPESMRQLLDQLLDDRQDEVSPHQLLLLLPQDADQEALEELSALLEDDPRPFPPELLTRFRRSADAAFQSRREPAAVSDQSSRSIFPAASRIGRYLGDVSALRDSDPVMKGRHHQEGGDGDVRIIDATASKAVTSQASQEEREKQKKPQVTDPEAL